jgi:hypothetical protein
VRPRGVGFVKLFTNAYVNPGITASGYGVLHKPSGLRPFYVGFMQVWPRITV